MPFINGSCEVIPSDRIGPVSVGSDRSVIFTVHIF
jgi:hypothetical protein